jgi:ABC-type transporter Mla subunit MlaD
MAARGTRNNILAALFLLGSLALGVATSFYLAGGGLPARTNEYVVRFPVSTGAAGIRDGAPVQLGGQDVGRVTGVDFSGDASGDRFTHIDVRVRVDRRVTLFSDALVVLDRPLLGTMSSINIVDVGGGGAGGASGGASGGEPATVLAEGAMIEAGVAPGLLAQVGLSPGDVTKLKDALDATLVDARETARSVRALVDTNSPTVTRGIDDAAGLLADARAKWPEWSGSADRTLGNVEAATARLDPLLTQGEDLLRNADAGVAEVRALVEDNRARVDNIVESVERFAVNLDTRSYDQLRAALEQFEGASAAFARVGADVAGLVDRTAPELERTLANARLASDNAKLAMAEVRAAPWRLLYRPTKREEQSQLLYDTARVYAEAVSDLRAAGEALRASDAPPDEVAPMIAEIREALDKYRQAERGLMDRLLAVPPQR